MAQSPLPDRAPDPSIGASVFIGGFWFQYLGRAPAEPDATSTDRESTAVEDDRLWLYPHLDGCYEIFRERARFPEWQGELGSVFEPNPGRFRIIFSVTEVLNFLLATESSPARRKAARLLELFKALHGGHTPYYLAPSEARARRSLTAADRDWIETKKRWYEQVIARVDPEGTGEIGPRLFRAPRALRTAEDHYRELVRDGYLDIAIVGGNSLDESTERVHTRRSILDLREALGEQGFRSFAQGGSTDATSEEKVVEFFGQPVRIRIRASGASTRHPRIRRTVAYFVEGLAHADVVIYHGHSNRKTGIYYLSESRTKFSRFRMGLHDQGDLDHKCHGLAVERYQILALQSCFSFEKYCLPVESYFARAHARRPGVIGNAHLAYFADFTPRYTEFIRLLASGAGPRELSRRLNAIRPLPDTPALLMRGMLQPRGSFVVPRGVTIVSTEERGPESSFQTIGVGSDGREYVSTDSFPQDRPGQIVQIVGYDEGAFGLDESGAVWHFDRRTQGEATVIAAAAADGSPFRFIAAAFSESNEPAQLFLLAENGTIYERASRSGRLQRSEVDRKRGERIPVAIGNLRFGEGDEAPVASEATGPLGMRDAQGRHYRWLGREGWEPVEGPVRFEANVTPRLGDDGTLVFTDPST